MTSAANEFRALQSCQKNTGRNLNSTKGSTAAKKLTHRASCCFVSVASVCFSSHNLSLRSGICRNEIGVIEVGPN